MKIVNLASLPEIERRSPKGKYQSFCKNVSLELGADPTAADPAARPPFDLQIRRLPPGKAVCPCHSHSQQWEMFFIVSGRATVRRDGQTYAVSTGDSFIHPPGGAHQITNASTHEDLVIQIIADHPPLDSCHYPDSGKWALSSPKKFFRMTEVDYFDGEE